jgi:hypothetical protein
MQLEGKLADINVAERLVEMWREKFTGAFRFEQDGVIKILYFKSGDVLSASTNDRTDSIDEILLRSGKISREHIKQALAKRKESETLGDALLNLGFITRKELTWARRVQVIGILRSIQSWTEGTYTGVADYLPKREEGTLFPLPQVILELIVTDSDRARFEQAMDGGAAVFAKSADFDEAYRRLGLNEDADAIVGEIDGEKSAADVASASGKDAFNVYKLLEALRALGVVTRIERTHGVPEVAFDDFETAGVADASDAWEPSSEPELDISPAAETPVPDAAAPVLADIPLVVPSAPHPAPEPAWGFDEAQLETARRAAEPPPVAAAASAPPPKAKGGRWGAIMLALLLVVAAFGGYYGWQWWQEKNGPAPQAVVVRRGIRPRPAARPTPDTGTVVPVTPTPPAQTATVVTTTTTAPTMTGTTGTVAKTPVQAAAGTVTTGTVPPTTTSPRPMPAATQTIRVPAAAPQAPSRLERTTTGGAVITNSPSAPTPTPANDALRSKYDAMARQQAADPVGVYTVQFELVCETASITKAMEAGRSSVWWVPISYHGKPCYRVFWGRFATRDEALQAAREIPAALRGSSPVVVKIPR